MRRISIILFTVWSCFILLAQTDKPGAISSAKPRFLPVSEADSVPSTRSEQDSPSTLPPAKNQAPVATPSTRAETGDSDAAVGLDDKHKLLAGDRLTFRIQEDRIFEDRDRDAKDANSPPQQIITVTDSGELNVPYIGLVTVSGKTCREAAADIKKLLEKDYYYKASVVLGLDQATKVVGHFYIYGYVKSPNSYDLPVNEVFTAGKAISRAGGFSDFANKKNVKIIRTVEGKKQTLEVNMVDVLEKGKIENDIPLLPDDYIFVDKKLFNM